jgi:hypothetical protein
MTILNFQPQEMNRTISRTNHKKILTQGMRTSGSILCNIGCDASARSGVPGMHHFVRTT